MYGLAGGGFAVSRVTTQFAAWVAREGISQHVPAVHNPNRSSAQPGSYLLQRPHPLPIAPSARRP